MIHRHGDYEHAHDGGDVPHPHAPIVIDEAPIIAEPAPDPEPETDIDITDLSTVTDDSVTVVVNVGGDDAPIVADDSLVIAPDTDTDTGDDAGDDAGTVIAVPDPEDTDVVQGDEPIPVIVADAPPEPEPDKPEHTTDDTDDDKPAPRKDSRFRSHRRKVKR